MQMKDCQKDEIYLQRNSGQDYFGPESYSSLNILKSFLSLRLCNDQGHISVHI